jgi:3-methyladenine DNA glycosylase/8-oxoguanine DNA glycosylase
MSALRSFDDRPLETTYRPPFEVDLLATLAEVRHGRGDPTIRFVGKSVWRATRTDEGPAAVLLEQHAAEVRVRAWGSGAAAAVEGIPRLLGHDDHPEELVARHARVAELQRRFRGLRFGRTDAVFEALLPAILEQKVTGIEARASYRGLIRSFGEAAPGPGLLRLPPTPERLAAMPYFVLHPLGLEQRRATVIRRAAERAAWLERAGALPPAEALARLRSIPGIGPWTAAETARTAFGDPDAISVGDFHLKNMVCWALAREPRGTDERMLEVLEPYRGQRARVCRLLERAGIEAPKFGPRNPIRSIAGL